MKASTIVFLAITPLLAIAATLPTSKYRPRLFLLPMRKLDTSNLLDSLDLLVRDAIDTYNSIAKREAENVGAAAADGPLETRACKDPKSLCYPNGFASCYSNCFQPACPFCSIGCSISCSDICGNNGC